MAKIPLPHEVLASQLTTQQLRDELMRRDIDVQNFERSRRDAMAELYLEKLPELIQLNTKHDTDRCSDTKWEEEQCFRCALLYAREYNEWPRDQEIIMTTRTLPDLGTIKAAP